MRAERDDKEKSKGSVVVNVVIKQQEKETVDMRNMPMGVNHVVISDESIVNLCLCSGLGTDARSA
jgi:hypothetical protein